MQERIPFNRPSIVGKELFYIADTIVGQCTSGNGPYTKKCETWLQDYLGCGRALLVHSCTAALEMAAMLCEFEPGDEVIMPSFTFVSTANAFALRGIVPVFVDVSMDTLCLDLEQVEKAIGPKTRGIVAVHYAGRSCDMYALQLLCRENNLVLIEDAAQSLLSRYQDRYLGTFGDFACLSFHETKNIVCGEGGALIVNNKKYLSRAEILRDKGTNRGRFFRGEVDKYTWVDLGSSYLPSDMVAAFLYGQLEHANMINTQRSALWMLYFELLEKLEREYYIARPIIDQNNRGNGHIFYIITNSLQERTELINYLKDKGICAVFHYTPLHTAEAGLKYCKTYNELPNTDFLSDRLLRLPLYYELTEAQVRYICGNVSGFYNKNEPKRAQNQQQVIAQVS